MEEQDDRVSVALASVADGAGQGEGRVVADRHLCCFVCSATPLLSAARVKCSVAQTFESLKQRPAGILQKFKCVRPERERERGRRARESRAREREESLQKRRGGENTACAYMCGRVYVCCVLRVVCCGCGCAGVRVCGCVGARAVRRRPPPCSPPLIDAPHARGVSVPNAHGALAGALATARGGTGWFGAEDGRGEGGAEEGRGPGLGVGGGFLGVCLPPLPCLLCLISPYAASMDKPRGLVV